MKKQIEYDIEALDNLLSEIGLKIVLEKANGGKKQAKALTKIYNRLAKVHARMHHKMFPAQGVTTGAN